MGEKVNKENKDLCIEAAPKENCSIEELVASMPRKLIDKWEPHGIDMLFRRRHGVTVRFHWSWLANITKGGCEYFLFSYAVQGMI